jgi:hypothetical protein
MKKTQDATANVATTLLKSIHEAVDALTRKQASSFNATITEKIIPLGNDLIKQLENKPSTLQTRAKLRNFIGNFTTSAPSLKPNALNGAASRISAFQMAVEEAEEILTT